MPMRTHDVTSSHRIIHLLLIAMIAVFAISFIAVNSPSSAAPKPAQVKGLKVIWVDDYSFSMEWKDAKNAELYQVQYKKASARKWINLGLFTEDYYDFEVPKCDTKYYVRVRGYNDGRYGSWSSVKSAHTTIEKPMAIWCTHIDDSSIEVQWAPSKGAKEYRLTWDDMTEDILGTKIVKKTQTSYRVTGLAPSCGYSFKVQAKNGKKKSNQVLVDTGTFDETNVLDLPYPTASSFTLTRFTQHGSEYDMPVLWGRWVDSEGYVQDEGFYFLDMDLQELVVKDATLKQPGQEDVNIKTDSYKGISYKVGGTIEAPDGSTYTISGLHLYTMPNIVFDNCESYHDAYDKIDDFTVIDYIKERPANPLSITWEQYHYWE